MRQYMDKKKRGNTEQSDRVAQEHVIPALVFMPSML